MIEECELKLDKLVGMFVYGRPDAYIGPGPSVKLSPSTFRVYEIGPEGEVALPETVRNVGEIRCKGREVLKYVMCKVGVPSRKAVELVEQTLKAKVSYAGLKDAEAFTCQFITVKCRPGRKFKDRYLFWGGAVRLFYFGKDVIMLRRGELEGNVFEVLVEGFTEELCEAFSKGPKEVIQGKPFPNYFGYQRFGTRRPVTHIIGKHVLLGNYEEAVNWLLGHPFPAESSRSREARALYDSGRLREALEVLPKSLVPERRVLQRLIDGASYEGALRSVGIWLIRLYIEAYQSYLFNVALSDALRELGSVESLMSKCDVFPIPHPDVRKDKCSKYVVRVLAREGIGADVPGKKLMVRGVRETYFNVLGLKTFRAGADLLNLRFSLRPSVYATVMLREMLRGGLKF